MLDQVEERLLAPLDVIEHDHERPLRRSLLQGEVDLEDELWGPVFEPLRQDPELFRQVRVDEELGTVVWPNGADLDPDVLHGDLPSAASATEG